MAQWAEPERSQSRSGVRPTCGIVPSNALELGDDEIAAGSAGTVAYLILDDWKMSCSQPSIAYP